MENNLLENSAGSTDRLQSIRTWPVFILAASALSCMLIPTLLGMDDSVRFMVLAGGAFLHLLLLGGWLMFASASPWRDRLIFVALGAVSLAVVFGLQHRSLGISVLMFGVPISIAVLAFGLARTKAMNWKRRRWVAFLVWFVSLVIWLPTRSEGLKASFAPELRWRWSPDVEERAALSRVANPDQAVEKRDLSSIQLQPGDWPRFRGVNSNGISDDSSIVLSEAISPKLLWKRAIGPAWSSVCVVDGLLYTQEQQGPSEAVVCLDAATGQELWTHAYNARFEDQTQVSGVGPRSTPTFADGKIYTVGGTGIVLCLDAGTGKVVWSGDITKDCGTSVPMWGFSTSPLVQDGRCYLLGGGVKAPSKDCICYDAVSGEMQWTSEGDGETYSSPQSMDVIGERLVIASVGPNVVGRNSLDGVERWRIEQPGIGNVNLQPISLPKEQILVASGEGEGTSLYELKTNEGKSQPVKKWTCAKLRPDFSDVAVMDDLLFGFTKGLLTCVDMADGKVLWKKLRFGSAQLIAMPTQHSLLVLSEKGELSVIRVDREGPESIINWPAVTGKTWNHPVLVKNRIYCRSAEELACYEL